MGNEQDKTMNIGITTIIYVPICKHPRDFMFTFGPVGYERVEKVKECPLLIRKQAKQGKDDASRLDGR
jgi:hypothetical protein